MDAGEDTVAMALGEVWWFLLDSHDPELSPLPRKKKSEIFVYVRLNPNSIPGITSLPFPLSLYVGVCAYGVGDVYWCLCILTTTF